MHISCEISSNMVDLITKRRLFKAMDLEKYADWYENVHGIMIHNGDVIEYDNTPGNGGTRTIRKATDLDYTIFGLLRDMGMIK